MDKVEKKRQKEQYVVEEIKESGKHDELMSQNGAYRHLYESQMALENYGKGGMA